MEKEVFKKIFDEPYDKNQELDEVTNNLLMSGNKAKLKEIVEKEKINVFYRQDYLISWLSWLYTLNYGEDKLNMIKDFILNNYGEDIYEINTRYNEKYKSNELYFKTVDGEVCVRKLSEVIPAVKKHFLDHGIDIETTSRNGECYNISHDISLYLGKDNDIVTGFIYGNTDKSKFLHSWVETNLFGEYVVIDGTSNSIINKSGYYSTRHINENEILQRLNVKTLKKDYEEYGDFLSKFNFSLTIYLTSRDEIIKELDKNKEIIRNKVIK